MWYVILWYFPCFNVMMYKNIWWMIVVLYRFVNVYIMLGKSSSNSHKKISIWSLEILESGSIMRNSNWSHIRHFGPWQISITYIDNMVYSLWFNYYLDIFFKYWIFTKKCLGIRFSKNCNIMDQVTTECFSLNSQK